MWRMKIENEITGLMSVVFVFLTTVKYRRSDNGNLKRRSDGKILKKIKKNKIEKRQNDNLDRLSHVCNIISLLHELVFFFFMFTIFLKNERRILYKKEERKKEKKVNFVENLVFYATRIFFLLFSLFKRLRNGHEIRIAS